MVRRAKKSPKKRKAKKSPVRRKKASRKTKSPVKRAAKKRKTKRSAVRTKRASKKRNFEKTSPPMNKQAHWAAYRELQKRVDKAWDKLQADVQRKASPDILVRNKNELLLLLGECNYMARECMQLSSKEE